MLDRMREFGKSYIAKALFWLLIIVFCFWGTSYMFFNQVKTVAKVNGTTILSAQVDSEAQQIRNTLQHAYGARAASILKAVNLREEALQRIIENQLVVDEARKLGLRVTDKDMRQAIAAIPAFQVGGQFNFDQYQAVLRNNDLMPAQFEADERGQMVQDLVRNMVGDSFAVSNDEVRQAFDLANQNLRLAWFEVPYSAFTSDQNPTAAAVNKFYERNKQAFQIPDKVKISYITYSPAALAADLKFTDKRIETYYQSHLKTEFTHPEQVRARHILIKVAPDASAAQDAAAKKLAEEIMDQIQHGKKFAVLALKYSDDNATATEGGELGFFSRGQLVKPFEDAAFKLKPGQMTVVRTKFGWHVIQVEQVKPAHVDTLAEARPGIVDALREAAGKRTVRVALDQDLSLALSGTSIDAIAKKRGLTVVTTPFFAQNEQAQGVPANRKLVAEAFKYDKGQSAVVTSGKIAYLLRVDARQAAHIPPLKEIEQPVRQALIDVNAQTKAHELAKKLLAELKTPADFEKVAAENKFPVDQSGSFNRAARQVPGIGDFAEVTSAAALVPKLPGVIPQVMDHDGNAFIFKVIARTPPSGDLWIARGDSFRQQYVASRRAETWQNFLDALKSRATIKINASRLGSSTAAAD